MALAGNVPLVALPPERFPFAMQHLQSRRTTAFDSSSPPQLLRQKDLMTEEEEDTLKSASASPPPSFKCLLHKHIRNKQWTTATERMQTHPAEVMAHNRVGWSSLILALYHEAPVEIIAAMLATVSHSAARRQHLLAAPVPNGNRVALHFAARYARLVDVFSLLVEAYPVALLLPSADGNRPVDRAVYYRQNVDILNYLHNATEQETLKHSNPKLRRTVLLCCRRVWEKQQEERNHQRATAHGISHGEEEDHAAVSLSLSSLSSSSLQFVVNLYGYTMQREMHGLFRHILSYVGIPSPAGRRECRSDRSGSAIDATTNSIGSSSCSRSGRSSNGTGTEEEGDEET